MVYKTKNKCRDVKWSYFFRVLIHGVDGFFAMCGEGSIATEDQLKGLVLSSRDGFVSWLFQIDFSAINAVS